MLTFNASPELYQWIGLVVSVFIPILVDLITKKLADPKIKALVLALLSAINGFLVELLQANDRGQEFVLNTAAMNAVTTFVLAVAVFFGFWRPAGVSGKEGVVQAKFPGGVGKEVTPVAATTTIKPESGNASVGMLVLAIGLLLLILAFFTTIPLWVGVVVLVVGVILMFVT